MKLAYLFLVCFVVGSLASYLKDWERVSSALPQSKLTFYVALHQRNLDKLEGILYAISTPGSPRYGEIVDEDTVKELIFPSDEEHDRVHNFLTITNNADCKSYGDALKCSATVSELSQIFSATFHLYRHGPSGRLAIRADIDTGIVIPEEIEKDVYMITGLTGFPIIQKSKSSPLTGNVEDTQFGFLAPDTIRRIYDIPPGTKATNPQTSQAAVEFAPEAAFSYSDYLNFTQLSNEQFYNFSHIVGVFNPNGEWGNLESQLDVSLIGTIGAGSQNWFWTVTDGWIYEMAVDIWNNATKPWVFSISYGWPEILTCPSAVVQANCEGGNSAQYINRANAELMKLGTSRITVVTCSQDEGAPSEANEGCYNQTHPVFGIYPGSSPYVLSVSGSAAVPDKTPPNKLYPPPPICQVQNQPCTNSSTEWACTPNTTAFGWATGGGFSEITAAPAYQAAAVKAYLSSNSNTWPLPKGYFNPANRGYPDVSAIGARVLIVDGGQITVAEGTSASTPIVAGIVSLLNDYRFNNKKTPLGFFNPALYTLAAQTPKAFNDITQGANNFGCTYGYGCAIGWDAVTGLGSPNYTAWLAYVKTLQ